MRQSVRMSDELTNATSPPLFELSEIEAFDAMRLFLRQFADRAGDDLLTLLGDVSAGPNRRTFDPAAWDDWLRCVRAVKNAGEGGRT